MIEVLDSNGYPIHRSISALAQLLPTDKYIEPYPDFTGEHRSINLFRLGSDNTFFNFGQGMITRIKYVAGYILNKKPNIQQDSTESCDYSERIYR